MSGINITYWLRKTPQPVAVLADSQRIEVPKNGRAWRDLTATIKAMEPAKLTCLDGQGNVIRSIVLETEDSPPPAATPEMTDVQLFAKLIAEAYDKGAVAQQPIIDNAMQFVERQGQRLAKAESEIERLRLHIHKLNLRISELSQVPVDVASEGESIMGALVAGALQGAAAQQSVVSPIKSGGKK